jgi:chemotaxis protein histidine kinase CheA
MLGAAMLARDEGKANSPLREGRAKSGEKREGADSQNVGHFAGSAPHSAAPARGSRAPAGAAPRDGKARPAPRRAKRSETFRLRLTTEELDALHALAKRTGINRSRLARKALRELVTGGVHLLDREQLAALEVARQLRQAGINLNQIARRLNQLASDRATLRQLEQDLAQLNEAVMQSEDRWRGLVAMARNRIVPEHGRD